MRPGTGESRRSAQWSCHLGGDTSLVQNSALGIQSSAPGIKGAQWVNDTHCLAIQPGVVGLLDQKMLQHSPVPSYDRQTGSEGTPMATHSRLLVALEFEPRPDQLPNQGLTRIPRPPAPGPRPPACPDSPGPGGRHRKHKYPHMPLAPTRLLPRVFTAL